MLLDEIYVEPKVTYKAGIVKGFDGNCDMTQATTVQAFMICSILSHRKDIAALVPVKNLTAPYLQEITMHVIRMVEKASFRIICLISDNNRVNGNMFRLLCGGLLQPCIDHPCDNSRKLFFLFDTVHIFKCIRNNWINQKDSDQTFLFPDMLDANLLHKAKFNILKQLHENEKNNLVKLAPSLSFKALNPSNTERQSVPLMLCIFNEKVVAALTLLSQQQNPKFDKASVDDTLVFIDIIVSLWKMLNVKHPFKDRNLQDQKCDPVRKVDDHQLLYFDSVVQWLQRWEAGNTSNRNGMLTRETASALQHTLKSMVLLVRYLLESLDFKYVLMGKFQTDYLEYRFSQYRRLAGTNFHIFVREIMECEKKLKLSSILHINSASKGKMSIVKFANDCALEESDDVMECDTSAFEGVLCDSNLIGISDPEMHVVVFLAGYIEKKN